MSVRLIIEDNTVYEIDEDCICRKNGRKSQTVSWETQKESEFIQKTRKNHRQLKEEPVESQTTCPKYFR